MMKKWKQLVLMSAMLSLMFGSVAYAKNDGFVGQNIEFVKAILEAENSEYEIIYKYEDGNSYLHNTIISQTYEGNQMIVTIQNGTPTVVTEESDVKVSNMNSFKNGSANITIDGNYSDWANLPVSYEYNWDNSENCWIYGEWIGNDCYMTPEGTYDNNVRHGMQMYCDGEYVYVHIKYARIYEPSYNAADYRFYIDEEEASFTLDMMDGTHLMDVHTVAPGSYPMKIRHRDSANSYIETNEASGILTVYEDKQCSDFEFKIPLASMQEQNQNISLTNIGTIAMFNPNLMYRRITCVGTSTGPIAIGVSACVLGFFGGYFYKKMNERFSKKQESVETAENTKKEQE